MIWVFEKTMGAKAPKYMTHAKSGSGSAMQTLCKSYANAMQSLSNYYANAMQALQKKTMQTPCKDHTKAMYKKVMQTLCIYYANPINKLCKRYATNMKTLCALKGFKTTCEGLNLT